MEKEQFAARKSLVRLGGERGRAIGGGRCHFHVDASFGWGAVNCMCSPSPITPSLPPSTHEPHTWALLERSNSIAIKLCNSLDHVWEVDPLVRLATYPTLLSRKEKKRKPYNLIL